MTIPEILRQFERVTRPFPRDAVRAAIERRQEIAPELIRILEETIEHADELADEGDYTAHLYAMYLLAQFRDTRAFPLVIRLVTLPGDLPEGLCGDFITEALDRVLASVCGGDPRPIQTLLEDDKADQWTRVAALSSLANLAATGEKPRAEIDAYFSELFEGKLERQPSSVWGELVAACCDLHFTERFEDIKKAYDDGLVDPSFVGFDEVEADFSTDRETILARLSDTRQRRLIDDTIREMGWWACFQDKTWNEPPSPVSLKTSWAPPVSTSRPTRPKIGRNEPCPCGSAKKYKKCCGA